jgi:benzodiazapine receptor
MERTRARDIVEAVVSIVVCQGAGLIGSVATFPSIPTWYASLDKPPFNPPNWVFGPVWTTLYTLMGIAAFLVWRKGIRNREVKIALGIFIIQLVLNTLWSVIFFGLNSLAGGLVVIVVLWIAILLTIITFFRISKVAGALLIPYILWVSFATILNFSLWQLNA